MKNSWIFILLTTLILITYATSLDNAFVSDDLPEILNNPSLNSFGYIIDHYYGFIRPTLYFVIYQVFGLEPLAFRLINILFHIGSTWFIYLILKRFFTNWVPIVSTIIFAVHPLISEPIIWISGGMYVQYSFFVLGSFLFYLKAKDIPNQNKFYLLSILFYFLTMASYPTMASPFLVILGLYELTFVSLKKHWKLLIPFILLTTIWAVRTYFDIPQRVDTLQNMHYQEKGIDNPLIQIPIAISSYLELLVWPKDLTIYHSELSFSQGDFIFRALITLGFFIAIIMSFFKNKLIFFWLSFFLLSLGPSLTPFRLNWIVAERYSYLPIIGLIASSVYLIHQLILKKKGIKEAMGFILILIILGSMIRIMIRSSDWQDADSLWLAAESTSPSSPVNHNNLGDLYGRRGDLNRAVQEFQTAIILKPNYADAYHNLGNTYNQMGELDKALASYQKALEFNPNLWQSYQNIAAIYFNQEKFEEARQNMEKAATISPNNLNVLNNLAVIYFNLGDKDKAKQIFVSILAVDSNNPAAKLGLEKIAQ